MPPPATRACLYAATNEMCILHGTYWPRLDSTTELCLGGTRSTSAPGQIDDGGTTD